MIAIARAWQMIGAWNTRVAAMMGDLLRERSASAAVADGIEDDGVPVADPFVSLEY
jgi:orotate phosphoribosyltransferase-like protein